jgi:hypothetical protein
MHYPSPDCFRNDSHVLMSPIFFLYGESFHKRRTCVVSTVQQFDALLLAIVSFEFSSLLSLCGRALERVFTHGTGRLSIEWCYTTSWKRFCCDEMRLKVYITPSTSQLFHSDRNSRNERYDYKRVPFFTDVHKSFICIWLPLLNMKNSVHPNITLIYGYVDSFVELVARLSQRQFWTPFLFSHFKYTFG